MIDAEWWARLRQRLIGHGHIWTVLAIVSLFCVASGAVFPGLNHAHIANHPEVYEALREMLSSGQESGAPAVPELVNQG